jgi:hypothetical protein
MPWRSRNRRATSAPSTSKHMVLVRSRANPRSWKSAAVHRTRRSNVQPSRSAIAEPQQYDLTECANRYCGRDDRAQRQVACETSSWGIAIPATRLGCGEELTRTIGRSEIEAMAEIHLGRDHDDVLASQLGRS